MKMQINDIVPSRKLGSPCLKVVEMKKHKDVDPIAEIYRKVRDAALFTADVPAATRIAVLELVKAELVRNMQATLDESEE